MIISDHAKLLFIHVHRTGGSTIGNLIKNHSGKKVTYFTQHENARTSKSYLIDTHKDYYSFGFTRNPWERILSWYSLINLNQPQSLIEERKRFEMFIKSDAASDFATQYFHYNSIDYLTNEEGKLKVDKIFRYENYAAAVLEIQERFSMPPEKVPILNNTPNKDYHDFYTKESQRLIAEKCRLDIEYFNYEY